MQMEIRHLGREVKTALELAIAALAPSEIVDRLATAAGLLDALAEFPEDTAPALAFVPETVERARRSLAAWQIWQKKHLPKASA
jgi:hypothetical protein